MNRYQKWAVATTLATFLLILLGGMVRASDAGLGCPDWPTCFGEPYPPFTMEELRARDVPADFDLENFEVRLAWIEYVNRLSGVIIGLLVVGSLAYALVDHRDNKHILYPTIGAFVAVILNGSLGRAVITSGLNQWVISMHLFLAWIQVSFLIYGGVAAFYPQVITRELPPQRQTFARGTLLVLFLAYIQALLGSQVRARLENIEDELGAFLPRGEWIAEVGLVDQIHRSFSWVIFVGIFWMAWYAHTKLDYNRYFRYGTQITALAAIAQVAVGIGLAYADLPPVLQPIHLVVGSVLLGAISVLYLLAARLPVEAEATTPEPTSGAMMRQSDATS